MDKKLFEKVLTENNVVAVLGFSANHTRPSNRIGRYLMGNEFKVYGVNPLLKGKIVDEITCVGTLAELPPGVEIINVFRRSEFLTDHMKEILELDFKPKVVWTQIGVISSEAMQLAERNNIVYIENHCIMVEHSKI